MLREGEMDVTTREPGDLPQTNTSTGGVSEGRVCVRDDPARAASPDPPHNHFGVKSMSRHSYHYPRE